jgi:hypothetical protein
VGRVDQPDVIKLRCFARTHASITVDRRYVRIRCNDDHCPECAYAKDNGLISIHAWDLWTPENEGGIIMVTDFEEYRGKRPALKSIR